jgi:hypothetical protein
VLGEFAILIAAHRRTFEAADHDRCPNELLGRRHRCSFVGKHGVDAKGYPMAQFAAKRDFLASDEAGDKQDLPCPICGGRSYSPGTLAAHGINFLPNDASILRRFFRIGFELRARRCDSCGNVQMFAGTPKAKRR